jgi:plasmid stability protein
MGSRAEVPRGRRTPRFCTEAASFGKGEIEAWPPSAENDMLLHMKRTTLLLDDELYATLKQRAAAEGRTLTAVVEGALRLGLHARAARRRPRVQLPSYDLGPFLVDPSDRGSPGPAPARGGA